MDLDNHIFTVNGVVHFKFDSMPPMTDTGPGFVSYLEGELPLPEEYFAATSLWPSPDFDIEKAQRKYNTLEPIVIPFVDWGAPTWGTLSVAQHLATCLIRALVKDNSVEFKYSHFPFMQEQLGLFCWQLTCAAAPSNLICPPEDAPPIDGMLYARTSDTDNLLRGDHPTIHWQLGYGGLQERFFWFRGYLIMFCCGLNEPAFMMREVERMVTRLRQRESPSHMGIIISSWHMVAVLLDGSEVHHSPVLDLHDGKSELKEGVLLLTHLLRPISTGSKTPWGKPPPSQPYNTTRSALPEDILREILYFSDHETYLRLSFVSRRFRSICLAQPRIGHHALLSKEPGSNPIFKVRSTSSSSTSLATLTRTEATAAGVDRHTSILLYQEYRPRNHQVLKPGLAGMFQHRQIGVETYENLPEGIWWLRNGKRIRNRPMFLEWDNIMSGEDFPELRIQVMDGVWKMVEIGSKTIGSTAHLGSGGSADISL